EVGEMGVGVGAPTAGPTGALEIGRSAFASNASPQPGQKRSSLSWMAAQRGFQLAHLGVHLAQRGELGEHQRVVALPEAVQIEHEPAEVAISELARLAQEARPAAHAATLTKAGGLRSGLGLRLSLLACRPRSLLGFVCTCHDPHAIRHQRRVSAMRPLRAPPCAPPRSPPPALGPPRAGPARAGPVRASPSSAPTRKVRTAFPPRPRAPAGGCQPGWPTPVRRTPAPRARPSRSPPA